MSVIVKGMKMPDDCCQCKLAKYDDYENYSYCPFTDVMCLSIGRQDACPLVALPEKHGRLIEEPDISEYEVFDEDTGTREISLLGLMECHRMVKDAPTVIEAEGE